MAFAMAGQSWVVMATLAVSGLAGCVSSGEGSMSSKSPIVFDQASDLCSVQPTEEQVAAIRARDDYAQILIALAEACPVQADAFGIGATSSIPDLQVDRSDGGNRQINVAIPAERGPDVTPPGGDIPVDENDPGAA